MKKNISYFILALLITNTAFSQNSNKITWHSFEDGVKLNSTTHKKIFIDIYTEWCGWCKVLDKNTFPDSTITRLMNKYFIAVKLDAERKDTIHFNGYDFINPNPETPRSPNQLASSLLKGRMSYPSMCYLDDSLRLITTVQSYLKPMELEPILEYIGSDKYLTITYDSFRLKYKPISGMTAAIKENSTATIILNFEEGKSTIPTNAYTKLDSLAGEMKKNTSIKIEIKGYTDNSTIDIGNNKLSENRAKAVYDYLVNKGIESTRMNYTGYGQQNPIGENTTEEGRKKNRRVEITVSSK